MSSKLYPYDAIFSPIRVNRMTLKNRVVMAPMGNLNMCEENGRPNDKMLQYFCQGKRRDRPSYNRPDPHQPRD
ncbi:hypothetical protein LC724_07515 [Blautia sp. RD014234]|nr:hypothetical protein [Blautia parvula]